MPFKLAFSVHDEYGFERAADFDAPAHERFMSSYLPVLARRAQRWEQLLGAPADSEEAAEKLRKLAGSRKLKRFVRKGVPNAHRTKVNAWFQSKLYDKSDKLQAWMVLSGADRMRSADPDLYDKMLSKKVDPDGEVVTQINTDLHRTFPHNVFFKRENQKNDRRGLLQPLFNVLLAFSNANSNVGYCQV